MIITSNCIFDSVNDKPYQGYILVKDEKILQVKKGKPKENELSQHKEVIHCGDKTLMPGFCDNHVHVFLGALALDSCSLYESSGEEDAAKKIYLWSQSKDVKETKREWIFAFGWSHYNWDKKELPTKKSLDKYFPDKAVIAFNDELHGIWVNSKALELCGITKSTKDPDYSEFVRDKEGSPTGFVLEQAAMRHLTDRALSFDSLEDQRLISLFAKRALKKGVTSVGDMEVLGISKQQAYRDLEHKGLLNLRIFFSPSIRESTENLLKMQKKYASQKLSFLGAKAFIDGTPLGHTGMTVEEYSDMPGYYGEPAMDLKYLREKVKELYKNHIPVRLHACGDGAVREGLDNIEAAQKEFGQKDIKNTIEHIESIHQEDLGRFSKTKTIASIQPSHLSMETFHDHPIFEILGAERSKLTWPGKSLQEHGARVSMGTDCPIVELDPINTLHYALNRVMEDGMPEGGWNPKEKFTLSEALKCSTIESAYTFNMEDHIGTLEKGKLADLIILSEDIFQVEPINIKRVYVEQTIFNGILFED